MHNREEGRDENEDDRRQLRGKNAKKKMEVVTWFGKGGGARGKSTNKQKELRSLNKKAAGKRMATTITKTATTTN